MPYLDSSEENLVVLLYNLVDFCLWYWHIHIDLGVHLVCLGAFNNLNYIRKNYVNLDKNALEQME